MNNKSRSTCVVCGKVRYQEKMHKIRGLWVCNHSRSRRSRDTKYYLKNGSDSMSTTHKCTYEHLRKMMELAIDELSRTETAVRNHLGEYSFPDNEIYL